MDPAYYNLQLVILNKHEKEYQRGDVIAFQCEALSSVLVKRVVAVPGDSAEIRGGTLYVNDLIYDYYRDSYFKEAGILGKPQYLKENQYIVIGDNIDRSIDSRYAQVGIVERTKILGKIVK